MSVANPGRRRILLGGAMLDKAGQRGWTVVNMKTDWKVVYPFDTNRSKS
jgi:hypothetical protein